MSITGVKTKCPYCGYHDSFSMFTWNRCLGGCNRDYLAMPLDKEEARAKVEALMELVDVLPDQEGAPVMAIIDNCSYGRDHVR